MGTDDQEGRPRLIAYVPHLNTGALAVDGTSAYLATAAGIMAVDLLRAKARVVVPLGGGTSVSCLAVDATHLYALTNSPEGGALLRVPLGGGAEEVLVDRMQTASSFALYGAHLFWVNGASQSVTKLPVVGGEPVVVAHSPFDSIRGRYRYRFERSPTAGCLVVDDGHVLWVGYHAEDSTSEPEIGDPLRRRGLLPVAELVLFKAPIDGGETEIFVHDFVSVEALAAGGGSLLWSVPYDPTGARRRLRRVPIRGGSAVDVVDLPAPNPHLAICDGVVYAGGSGILSVPLAGGAVRVVAPRGNHVSRLAVGPSGVVWTTGANNLFTRSWSDAEGGIDLANRPDDPAATAPEVSTEQRALEDQIDRILRRREPPEAAVVERVRVTFGAPFASFWRITPLGDAPRLCARVAAADEPTEEALDAFERAMAIDRELDPIHSATFVHTVEAPPTPPDNRIGAIRLEHIDAFAGAPRWSDVVARQRAYRERTEQPPSAAPYHPALFEPLRARIREDGAPIADARADLVEALVNERGLVTLLVGDPGSGKTFLLREIARALEAREGGPAPLLVDVGASAMTIWPRDQVSIDTLLQVHFKAIGVSRIDMHWLRRELAEGRAVLLLDHAGDTPPVDFRSAARVLARACGGAPATANVIVACNTTHFLTRADEAEALRALAPAVATARTVEILPLDRGQIERALSRRLPEAAPREARVALLDRDPELLAVVENPRFLAGFASIGEDALAGQEAARVLEAIYASPEWNRNGSALGLRSLFTHWRIGAERPLMRWMWSEGVERIQEMALPEWLLSTVRLPSGHPASSPAEKAHGIAQCGSLRRDAEGSFSFVHASLAEWIVAHEGATEVLRLGHHQAMEVLGVLLRTRPMSPRMATFFGATLVRQVGKQHEAKGAFNRFVDWARDVGDERGIGSVAAGNARAVLLVLGVGVAPAPELDAAAPDSSLAGRDLRNADLHGRDLRGRDLAGAGLTGANLADADLEGANLRGAVLRGANAARARLSGADLARADLSCADLRGADLSGAKLEGAALRAAKLTGARIDPGALDRCDTFGAALSASDRVERMTAPAGDVRSVAFHPSGLFIATADVQRVSVWDAETGACLRVIPTRGRTERLAFSPDGRWIATGGTRVDLWDPCTGAASVVHTTHNGAAELVWAPDGSAVAAAMMGGTVWIYDVPTLAERRSLFEQHGGGGSHGLAWSRDGSRIATSSRARVRVWDARTGKELRALVQPASVEKVALSPDGRVVAAVGNGTAVHFWDTETGELVRSYRIPGSYKGMAFSADFTKVAVNMRDQAVIVDAATGAELHRVRCGQLTLTCVAFSADGTALVGGMQSGRDQVMALVWDVTTGKMRCALRSGVKDGGGGDHPVWHVVGLARFELGELDPPSPERLAQAPRGVEPPRDLPPLPLQAVAAVRRSAQPGDRASSGLALWSRRFRGRKDHGWIPSVAVGRSGDLLLSGNAGGVIGFGAPLGEVSSEQLGGDSFLLAMDADGIPRSVRGFPSYSFLATDPEGGVVGALESQGTVVIEGREIITSGGTSVVVWRYGPSGELTFVKQVADSGFGRLRAMAVDPQGHIVLAGHVGGYADFGGGAIGTASDVVHLTGYRVQLDLSGGHLSTRAFPNADLAGCAVGESGTFAITGSFTETASFGGVELSAELQDRFLVKLDASGAATYAKRFDDRTYFKIALDPAGNLYAFGLVSEGCDFGGGPFPAESEGRPLLVKLDPKGGFLWGKWFAGKGPAEPYGVTVTPDGGVLLAGEFKQELQIGPEPLVGAGTGYTATPFLARLGPDGAVLWSRCYGDGQWARFLAVQIVDASHAVVAGVAVGDLDLGAGPMAGVHRTDTFVAKLLM